MSSSKKRLRPVVERATASVATTMTAAQITAIPMCGRNTFYTAIATPKPLHEPVMTTARLA